MRRCLSVTAVILFLVSAITSAQISGNEDVNSQRRGLLDQKLRLVESLVNSPASTSAAYGREAETPSLLAKGRQLLEIAKTSIAANRFDQAEQALNEALRSISAASARLSAEAVELTESALRDSMRDLGDQLASYRKPIADLRNDNLNGPAASDLLDQIDAMTAESDKLAASGRLSDANRKLAEAYRATVEGLVKLGAGKTMTLRLKFDRPADEYSYELRRFRANEILIDMMLAEKRAEADQARKVLDLVVAGRKFKDSAESQAQNINYNDAVISMEKAVDQLNRALQLLGVPVF